MTKRILCVCVGNIFRSAMLERFLRKKIAERGLDVEVESAGIDPEPGAKVRPRTLETMLRRGIDLSDHQSRRLDTVDLLRFDLVVAMTPRIMAEVMRREWREHLILANPKGGGIPDTKIGTPEEFESIATLTEEAAEEILAKLK